MHDLRIRKLVKILKTAEIPPCRKPQILLEVFEDGTSSEYLVFGGSKPKKLDDGELIYLSNLSLTCDDGNRSLNPAPLPKD